MKLTGKLPLTIGIYTCVVEARFLNTRALYGDMLKMNF